MPPQREYSAATRYAVAVASIAVGTLSRLALDPLLAERFPFATLFLAVLVSAWFGGFGPALLACALGFVASAQFLLPPRGSLVVDSEHVFGILLYALVSGGMAVLGGGMRQARLRAEATTLRERSEREQLRVTLESIGDAVAVTDAAGLVTSMNAIAAALTGWSAAEAIGRPLDEVMRLVNEDTRAPVLNPVREVLASGRPVDLANHTVLVARDGVERPIDDSAAPILDRDGTIGGVVLVFRDVTESRRARKELRRNEQELVDLFENASVGMHFVSPEGIVLRANRCELAMLGYDSDEYLGHHIAEFHVDREVIDDILRRLHAGEALVGCPARMRHKDGSTRDVLINSSVRWDHGRFVYARSFTLDVTTLRRGEEAQALLAAVVETSEDAIVTKTLEGVVTSWNQGAERLFGFAADEAVGRSITIIYPPERLDEEREILARLRGGERIEHFETQRVARDGRLLDISLAISPLRDGGGRVIGASMSARDITARKRTERALREEEARFRSLVGNAPAAIFIKDVEGRYTIANPLACKALGRTDSVVGLTDHDLLPRQAADAVRKRDLEVLAAGKAREGEETVSFGGLERRYLSVEFPLVGEEGMLGVCGVAIDITDRQRAEQALRESEERFRTLADNIAQFAWMADADGAVFWYNRRWFEYTGTTLQEVEGWGWKSVHHPDHVDRVVEKIQRCFSAGEVWEDTFPLRGRDGAYRWFLSRAVPIRDGSGKVLRWFGTNTDITAQREAEEALRRIDRRKDAFLATLAHELRNPLAPLRTSIEIMKQADGDASLLARAQATMDRQLTHLERLVDDLLDIARINRDQLELRREPLDLGSVVAQAVEACEPLAEKAGLELRVDLSAQPIRVDGDSVRLTQVLSNLLHNACKYSDPGGFVSVSTRADDELALISVRDTGQGIPPQMLSTVFEMFTQLDPGAERAQSGLGIGLTLVRRLVEMHGGTVEAHSDGLGRGSEFVVRLPRLTDPLLLDVPRAELPPRVDGNRRVLVVDDNADSAEALALLLRLRGHDIRVAHDGAEALRAAESFRPEVALLDVGLPVMSGLEVARAGVSRGTAASAFVSGTSRPRTRDRTRRCWTGPTSSSATRSSRSTCSSADWSSPRRTSACARSSTRSRRKCAAGRCGPPISGRSWEARGTDS
jgi:PAS domain S-box-containing protein